MDMKVQITNGMLVSLIITMVYAKALGVTQGIMAREAGGDIWLSTMIATLQGMLIMTLTVWIIRRTPDKNIVEQFEFLLGRWAGKIIGIVLFLFFIGAFITIMITFVYHIMDYFLPEAPMYVFFIVMLCVSLYGLFLGLEVVGRTAFLGLLMMVVFNILMIFGCVKQMDIRELQPMFQSGLWTTFWASRHNNTDWAMATLMVSLILPKTTSPKEWSRSAPIGVILGGIIVLLWPILEVTVLTPEMTAQYIVSCMQLARSAEIGMFLHRYEMIMVAMFIVPLFVQIILCLYCASQAISHTFGVFGVKRLRYFFLPVALILSAISYWIVGDHFRAMDFLTNYWPSITLPIAFGIPMILLIVGWMRRKKLRDYLASDGVDKE